MQTKSNVEQFRENYKATLLPKYYHGLGHYLFTFVVALTIIILIFYQIRDLKSFELVAFPLAFLLANIVEYLAHRYLLHRKSPFTKMAYTEHTLRHHFYFTHDHIIIRNHQDLHRVLFPWFGILFFVGMIGLPTAFIMSIIAGKNFGLILWASEIFYFLTYETIHMICHFDDKHWIFKSSLMREIKEHHRIHHNLELMGDKNFGIVGGLFDRVFKTKA
jgi:hypothetical protein